jgi:hypothetical protein
MSLTLLAAVATWLGLVDPKVWYLAVSATIWFVTWMFRRYAPDVWTKMIGLNPAMAQLWNVVLGALLSAAPQLGRPVWDVVQQTLISAVLGTLGANGLHAVLKAMPSKVIPYDGAEKRVEAAYERRGTPPGGVPPVGGDPKAQPGFPPKI